MLTKIPIYLPRAKFEQRSITLQLSVLIGEYHKGNICETLERAVDLTTFTSDWLLVVIKYNTLLQMTHMPNTKVDRELWNTCQYHNITDSSQVHYDDVTMSLMASQITSLTIVYSTVYSGADQRKLQSSASLAIVRGIHRDRWIPRTKGQ